MANHCMASADNISEQEFAGLLTKYDSCIEIISEEKGSRGNEKTLADLDRYRYEDATTAFGGAKPERPMELDDVKTLVSWKLRHGKFRPTLMKLVSSNDPGFVKETVQNALDTYKKTADAPAAVDILTKLKGIGPATASLLLAVHDPQRVIFFADEAYYWLCCGGKKDPIKYNAKEYKALNERTRAICKRLGAKAVDVERVAFVILRQQDATGPQQTKGKREKVESGGAIEKPKAGPAKRKVTSDDAEGKAPLRRSKRRANEA